MGQQTGRAIGGANAFLGAPHLGFWLPQGRGPGSTSQRPFCMLWSRRHQTNGKEEVGTKESRGKDVSSWEAGSTISPCIFCERKLLSERLGKWLTFEV